MASEHIIHPTPYKDINTLLLFMLTNIQAILRDQFVGFYLYGSLSLGDFDPGSSDVDFLVAINERGLWTVPHVTWKPGQGKSKLAQRIRANR